MWFLNNILDLFSAPVHQLATSFLSSANKVSAGPICQFVSVCVFKFKAYLLIQVGMLWTWLSSSILRFFLSWLSSVILVNFWYYLKMKTTPITFIQAIVTSNAAAWLSNVKLSFFYMTKKWKQPENEDKFEYPPGFEIKK